MKILPALMLLAPALLLAAPGQAKIPPSDLGRAALGRFQSLDSNHDGRLSWDELNGRGRAYGADTLFVLLDANGDGRLDLKEIQGKGDEAGARVARFDAYDVNKDGYVTRQEFPAFVDRRLFDALDANHDGAVSLAELRPAFAAPPRHAAPPPVREARHHHPPAKAGQPVCWIPSFNSGRVEMEMPVTSHHCRWQ
jgi:Ca2+-binding EF-hand superfamily protein